MQSFRSIKKIHLTILSTLLISGISFANPIGDIVEQSGSGYITRDKEQLDNPVGTEIVLKDEAQTVNGRMKIVFLDNEVLDMTEHTYAYIDEAYYDPDPNLSKMSIQMVQGTARFTSGLGKRINKANVNVSTPTAQISIKGTDFTTTVDEIGRSLVILLPDEETGESSGIIEVSNLGGVVVLDQPYQATVVATLDTPPTSVLTISNITPNMIDNMFIVNPPPEVKQALEEDYRDEQNQDQGILDVDFLEFNELETDALADTTEDLEFSELDIDFLDVDFLTDLLDVVPELERTTVQLRDVQESAGQIGNIDLIGAAFGFNKDSQYNVFVRDGDLVFFRNVNGLIEIIIASGNSGTLETNVESYQGIIEFGNGDKSIEIVINQSN
tara:strand:+ start:4558 stop:5709 length:1152 start_codon:yes stop_codon:yes gene_type:complete